MFEVKMVCAHEQNSQYWAFRSGVAEALMLSNYKIRPLKLEALEDGYERYRDSLHQCSSDLMAYEYGQKIAEEITS